jgi:DNA-binding transcriptional LysR family regulator
MNLMHFKYAVEVARTQSISKAAENLFMGQPNLSRAIRELETELGITIFNRTSKGISVTPEGENFLRYARRITEQVDEVEHIFKDGGKSRGRLSIFATRTGYVSLALREYTKKLGAQLPIDIIYRETEIAETVAGVENRDCDLGIVRFEVKFERYFDASFSEKHLKSRTLREFTPVLLISKHNKLANAEKLTMAAIREGIEISDSDQYVPLLPSAESRGTEPDNPERRIFIYDRESALGMLESVPESYMWASDVPEALREKYGLVQRNCPENTRLFRDVLVYRDGYVLTEQDEAFVKMLGAYS